MKMPDGSNVATPDADELNARLMALEILVPFLMNHVLGQLHVGGDPVGTLEKAITGPELGEKFPEPVQKHLKALFQYYRN